MANNFIQYPALALYEIQEVLRFGAIKYPPDNYKTVSIADHLAAAERHLARLKLAMHEGTSHYDSESGAHHAAHAACRLMFVLQNYISETAIEE